MRYVDVASQVYHLIFCPILNTKHLNAEPVGSGWGGGWGVANVGEVEVYDKV